MRSKSICNNLFEYFGNEPVVQLTGHDGGVVVQVIGHDGGVVVQLTGHDGGVVVQVIGHDGGVVGQVRTATTFSTETTSDNRVARVSLRNYVITLHA